jgi:hypothetical protein
MPFALKAGTASAVVLLFLAAGACGSDNESGSTITAGCASFAASIAGALSIAGDSESGSEHRLFGVATAHLDRADEPDFRHRPPPDSHSRARL